MAPSKPFGQQLRARLGLTSDVVTAVIKNALPSTAALWVIQSTSLGQKFDTVGFLPIIITILMTPSLPRIPYLRLLIFTLFLNCIVLCVCLLAGYCSTQARLHTTPPGGRLDAYNSSAAAVSGVWLVFTVWSLQTFRTFNPHRAKSVVLCSIFLEVSLITTAELSDMATIKSFNIQLFQMFLLGYAFSACSSLLVFPLSSRAVTLVDVSKMFDLSQKATALEKPFGDPTSNSPSTAPGNVAAANVTALARTFAKFEIDVRDAKRDVGWSRFSAHDLNEIVHHFRVLIMPMRGLFAVQTIRSHLAFGSQSSRFDQDNALTEPTDVNSKEHWDLIFDKLQQPILQLHQLTEEATQHCRMSLHMTSPHATKVPVTSNSHQAEDIESEKVTRELPGGASFVSCFEKKINQQGETLRLILTGLKNHDGQLGSVENLKSGEHLHKRHLPTASQGRLLFTLYIEHLYNGILESLLELVIFCDSKSANKRRLQLPGKKRMLKVIRRLTDHHHVDGDLEDIASEIPSLTPQMTRMSDSHRQPSHGLNWSRLEDYLEKPSRVIGSRQSFFGFRVACAVMTVAIVGFLGQTQQWFFNQRGMWAAIFIPFSMAPSSGEAKSMLLYRVLGSLLSIPLSLVNWYIVDGVPAGVIVFFLLFSLIQQYFLIKFPQWGSFWRPCIITYSIIIGYCLQDEHTHVPQPPATNTQHYPIYLIGPYRCLCTLVGVAVAYFWTVFPRPTSASAVMRRRLGQALFGLAEYHSCMHYAIHSWASGNEGDMKDKSSVAYRLMKVRHKLFVKQTAILAVIRDQSKFAGFDFSLGGRHLEQQYLCIADEVDRIMSYLNVVIFVSARFQSHLHRVRRGSLKQTGPWESGVSDLLVACKSTSGQVASLIHILASSVTNDQPLPPFLEAPETFAVARKLRKMRPDLMDIQHVEEEGYRAFAVIEVSVAMMTKSLDKVLQLVRDMVGEVGVDIGPNKNK